MFAFLFCFFAGASTMLEMFDLNVSPINIDDYEPESISHCLSEAPSESRGHMVPIAPTTYVAPDVEEGVEVMSTPTDPHVGMTFDSLDAAKSYYKLICMIQRLWH
jgi:hypothetical protein